MMAKKSDEKVARSTYPWNFVDPPPSDCYCPICGDILQEPMLTNCYGSHFCQDCLEPIVQASEPCPNKECQEVKFLSIVDKPKRKKVLELDVICPLKGRGCNWRGEVGTRDGHLDPQEGDCEFIDVECANGCGEEMERYELREHLERFCHKRPYTCEHCSLENIFEIITKDHIHEWPAYPITCPNNCGDDNITRSIYPQHLQVCPEQVVECDFSYAGCKIKLLRKNIAKHQQDDVYSHLSLQTAFVTKQLTERDKQLTLQNSWEDRFLEIEQNMEQLMIQHQQQEAKLVKKIDTLKSVVCKLGLCITFDEGWKFSLKLGNIANEQADIIVNATTPDVLFDYGIARALDEASDGSLRRHFNKQKTPINKGSLYLAPGGGKLQCKSVINAFGPAFCSTDDQVEVE